MSRLPCPEKYYCIEKVDSIEYEAIQNMPVTVEELSTKTKADREVHKLVECLKYGRECDAKDRFGVEQMEFTLQKGCLLRGIRVYIPKPLRKRVLQELHTAHFGMSKMKSLGRAYCWWHSMDRDIENLVSNCNACQLVRAEPKKNTPVHCWSTPTKVFERVHADYAGPIFGRYLFVLVDAFSKWPEVHIVPNMNTETTIQPCEDIFATFGLPNVFVSDHGTQFNSKAFQSFLKNNGITHKQGAPYHPATNGQAERFVQTVKTKLRSANCTSNSMNRELANILMAYRRSIHPATGKSPAMNMFGRQIQSKLELLLPSNSRSDQERPPKKQFLVGDKVAVRDYLSSAKWQFGIVKEVLGSLHYYIRLDDGRTWKRHVDQMRKVGEGVIHSRKMPEEPEKVDQRKDDQITLYEATTFQPSASLADRPIADEPTIAREKNDSPQRQTTTESETNNTDDTTVRRSTRNRRVPERYKDFTT
ncbi:uncharacterized protein K02A2.6-like [Rhagoletis pomonella]|uniref:uncharacterized protein K02A2.6-like n=1 Tax=Rhagoletis pomonella TaxID=28610 RepID=UPI00177D54C3|nr:uncharacterized protein K02A2.6-like [Rhagoletis pomonella]